MNQPSSNPLPTNKSNLPPQSNSYNLNSSTPLTYAQVLKLEHTITTSKPIPLPSSGTATTPGRYSYRNYFHGPGSAFVLSQFLAYFNSESETESEAAEDASIQNGNFAENTMQYHEEHNLYLVNTPQVHTYLQLYAKKKLEGRTQSENSIWRSWRDVENAEFWAFIAVIINMGTTSLANLQEY
ncbi:piggyBac transposable element-derived protein 4-like [Vespula squamosa]|uniref:PiggyBac transposable element-derived protein 4-like n=1 Tax=Vespula squamosa TaxID=30214 RepID=A0ABD2BH49_VESSQ